MSQERSFIAGKFIWTTGAYAASLALRFLTSVVLALLLGPEILGMMVVAQAVRSGAELLTDLGMEQNVVHSPHGDDEHFLNTVWTIQILRGLAVSIICAALSPLIASIYRLPVEIFLAMSTAPLLNSLMSTSIFTLVRKLDVKRRYLFEVAAEGIGLIINVALALAIPSIWAPILGVLLGIAARSALTYAMPHPKHRLLFDRAHAGAIVSFGKWIMLSSLAMYAAMFIDRLFLGRVVDMAVLGVYGLARTISDLPHALAGRMGFSVVFPVIAKERAKADGALPSLATTRLYFLLLVGFGIATVMAWSDWAVTLLYDIRYREAGWMLFLLLAGSWMSVLAALNEAAAFGAGKPQIVSLANLARLAVLAAALPCGFAAWGLPGAILAVPAGEGARYLAVLVAQRPLSVRFAPQDLLASTAALAVLAAWIGLRLLFDLGVPWALLPGGP